MKDAQKETILNLRSQGIPFTQIAAETGLPRNTVKSFCQRLAKAEADKKTARTCKNCGAKLVLQPKKKARIFCCDKCRFAYWNRHRGEIQHKIPHPIVCDYCGKNFDSGGNRRRKYCCRACYVSARWGEHNAE